MAYGQKHGRANDGGPTKRRESEIFESANSVS